MLEDYFKDIFKTYKSGDATEASFCSDLKKLLENFLSSNQGGKDENVFDIQQGVSIILLVKL